MTVFRRDVRPDDVATVEHIIRSSGFFSEEEVQIAKELVQANLAQGEAASGYSFVFLDVGGRTVGYSCWGPIGCTVRRYDMFWIAVEDGHRGKGYGKMLLERVEDEIAKAGGEKIYVETSSRQQYKPTRLFYGSNGYRIEAQLKDFYNWGDHKVIFTKTLVETAKQKKHA